MKMKFCSLLAGASLLALASGANAAQPVALSDSQMDHVTAGAVGLANAAALALGDVDAVTLTATNTLADTVDRFAIGQSYSAAVAASLLFNAATIAHSNSAASLP